METKGLPALMHKLRAFNTSSIRLKLTELEVYLPNFKIESQIKLTAGLGQVSTYIYGYMLDIPMWA
jgi:hypothetical protein